MIEEVNEEKPIKTKRKTHPAVMVLSLLIPIALIAALAFLYSIVGVRVGSESEYGRVYRVRLMGHTGWQWYLYDRSGNVVISDIDAELPYIYDDGQTVYAVFYDRPTLQEPWYDENEAFCVSVSLDTGETGYAVPENRLDYHGNAIPNNRPELCGHVQWTAYQPNKIPTSTEFVEIWDMTQEDVPCYFFLVTGSDGKELYSAESEAVPEVYWQDEETLIVTPVWDGEPHPMDFEPYEDHFWIDD